METFKPSLETQFRQLLNQREAALRALLDAADQPDQQTEETQAHEVTDFKELAARQSLETVDQAQAEQAAKELLQVMAAQRRLDENSYGRCLDCDQLIDLRRLTAMPATPFCTACQAAHEHERPAVLRH